MWGGGSAAVQSAAQQLQPSLRAVPPVIRAASIVIPALCEWGIHSCTHKKSIVCASSFGFWLGRLLLHAAAPHPTPGCRRRLIDLPHLPDPSCSRICLVCQLRDERLRSACILGRAGLSTAAPAACRSGFRGT